DRLSSGRRELALVAQLAELDAAIELVEGRGAPHGSFRERLDPDCRHADGIWLGRRGPVALDSSLRHLPLNHLRERLAGAAVEDEYLAALGDLYQCRDNSALAVWHIVERGLRGHVIVPDIVMDCLELPALAPRRNVESDDRGGIFLRRLGPVTAEEI